MKKVWSELHILLLYFKFQSHSSVVFFAKLSSSSSLVELSTVLIMIISTPTHPQDSGNETLLDYLGSWILVWKLYLTKIVKLAN